MITMRIRKTLHSALLLAALATLGGYGRTGELRAAAEAEQPFKPTWNSLTSWHTPRWLRDGKFGVYTHWGVYSVHAMPPSPPLVCQHSLLATGFA